MIEINQNSMRLERWHYKFWDDSHIIYLLTITSYLLKYK